MKTHNLIRFFLLAGNLSYWQSGGLELSNAVPFGSVLVFWQGIRI